MKQIAVIGSGIAGLSAAARLTADHAVTVYERNGYIGGHTNTVVVAEGPRSVPVDTGFMVYNEKTYPRLTRLFADLGVETMPTDMSFGVNHVTRNFFWGSKFPRGVFAQRRNLARADFWRMLRDMARFNRAATGALEDPAWNERSLADFCESLRLSRPFLDLYLLPMTAAIWSSPHDLMLRFPAATLIRFLHNHGLLGVTTQHPWRTVRGGSREYRERLIAPFRDALHPHRAAVRIETSERGATVTDNSGHRADYDAVLVATHADEALALLATPTADQARLLGAFTYSANDVTLHTDPAVMPPRRAAWMAWNYRVVSEKSAPLRASTHYWMNRLQEVSEHQDYFVSVNAPPGLVASDRIAWQSTYHHPNFDLASAQAQRELPSLNTTGPLFFAGSYFRYGFHEDALMAGQDAADALLRSFHAAPSPVLAL